MLNVRLRGLVGEPAGNGMLRAVEARSWRLRLPGLLALAWLLPIALLAALDAWGSFRVGGDLWATVSGNLVTPEVERAGIRFNCLLLASAAAFSVALGYARRGWWRRGVALAAAGPVPVLLATSHNVQAGVAALALLLPAVWFGRVLAARLFTEAGLPEAWAIGSALGLGLIQVVGLALGAAGALWPQAVWSLLGVATVVALLATRRQMGRDLAACRTWLAGPVARRPVWFFLTGIGLAYFWLNLIGALAPETFSDAVRQRTPTALAFATSGQIVVDSPDLYLPVVTPLGGELLYAVALAIGPLQSAKLLNFLVFICCTSAVAALGRRLGGARAGVVGALAFLIMPLSVWLAQAAYLDLFLTLYALVAILAILVPDRPDWRGTLIAGTCIGLGIAIKVHFGEVALGIGVVLGLATLQRGALVRTTMLGALLILVAAGAAAPWLARAYLANGFVPGFAAATQSIARNEDERPAVVEFLSQYGYPRSRASAILSPVTMTLRSERYGELPSPAGPFGGQIGYVLLGCVPLLGLARPRRRIVTVLAGALASFGLWFYVAQYLRYTLPLLALLCAVAGAAYVGMRVRCSAVARNVVTACLIVLFAASVGVQLRVPAVGRDYVLGREDRAAYLTKYLFCCSGYPALQLLDAEPGVTRVFAPRDPARLYARARLSSFETTGATFATADPALTLARLREGNYSHILIDRRQLPGDWDRRAIFDEEFLRRNAVLVGGGDNTYLYRLLPPNAPAAPSWAHGPELLPNGSFAAGAGVAEPGGWDMSGHPRYDAANGAILGTPQDTVGATVAVTAGVRYLLAETTRGEGGGGRIRLAITWLDRAGVALGTNFDEVPVSASAFHITSSLATAPPGASTARIQTVVTNGTVWYSAISLRVVAP